MREFCTCFMAITDWSSQVEIRWREKGNAYRILMKRSLGHFSNGRTIRILEDNIKLSLVEVGCEGGIGLKWLNIVSRGGLWCYRCEAFGA
jgi:hypothetical protein